MKTPKFCKDCKYLDQEDFIENGGYPHNPDYTYWRCGFKTHNVLDLVQGFQYPASTNTCYEERTNNGDGHCGEAGKNFAPKP